MFLSTLRCSVDYELISKSTLYDTTKIESIFSWFQLTHFIRLSHINSSSIILGKKVLKSNKQEEKSLKIKQYLQEQLRWTEEM